MQVGEWSAAHGLQPCAPGVECLAGCGYAPMVQIDDKFYEDLTPQKLDVVLDKIERGEGAPQAETPWYQAAASSPAAGPR